MTSTLMKKSTMTKKKLINSISQEKKINPNHVRHVIQAFLDKMTESLADGRTFGISGFWSIRSGDPKTKDRKKSEKCLCADRHPCTQRSEVHPGKKMRKLIEDKHLKQIQDEE